MPSLETPDAADATARACAWADRLEELGRVDDARRVLREVLDHPGDPVPAALRLAELEVGAGASARAVEILGKVLGDAPGNIPVTRLLSEALLADGKAAEAAKVVANCADGGAELSELAGKICWSQGRHAEAVAAFGRCASLSAEGRRMRRRSWWRSGGPFRRRRRGMPGPGPGQQPESAKSVPEPSDAMLEAVAWAQWLSDEKRHDEARQAISGALSAHGRHPDLLACAAKIEDDADTPNAALYLWREAYREAPDDVGVVYRLATNLAQTHVEPSRTYRVNDAIRVLDGFLDQGHPWIRFARFLTLLQNGASASRVVAAYGSASGLPAFAVGVRRRLWWRSAGPLGQLRVAMVGRFRRRRTSSQPTQQVPRTEAETEAVARVLDSIRGQPASTARERIEEAWRQHGRSPSLLLAYAERDAAGGAAWHCLALAAEAVRTAPDSLDTVCRLAWAVYSVHGYGAAVQVMECLPQAARQTTEARVILGDLHRYAGNFALATAAYGDPRDLNRGHRKNRRSCIRKGLLQRLRSRSRGSVEAVDLHASFDSVTPELALTLDKSASLRDQPAEMRDLLREALGQHGRHAWLLIALADAELRNGDRHACAALAAEAMSAAPADPLIAAAGIRLLWLADYDSDALRALDDSPGEFRSSVNMRATAGEICCYWRLWGLTVMAFGESGLEAWQWRRRRAAWWRSGGPFGRIRSSIVDKADTALSTLPLPARQAAALSALPLPAPVAAAVRGDLNTYRMNLAIQTEYRREVAAVWRKGFMLPAFTLIVFAAFTIAEQLRWPSAGIARGITAAAIATAAEVTIWLVGSRVRPWVCMIIAAGCGGGAWFLLQSPGLWQFGVGLVLAMSTLTVIGLVAAAAAATLVRAIRANRSRGTQAETSALNALLDLLGQLTVPQLRRDAGVRTNWMAALERIAVTLERDLPLSLPGGDPDSQRVIAAHAHGAAAALRGMKRTIALPDEASWRDLIKQLTGLATALARGDFAEWPPPQPAVTVPKVPRPLWWRVTHVVRTVLVIIGPPLVAFLIPLVAPLSGPGLAWLRFSTIVWALLAAIIALDPAISDRVAKMRDVLSLLRDAAPPKDASGQADAYGLAGAPPSALPGVMGRPADEGTQSRPLAQHPYRTTRHGR